MLFNSLSFALFLPIVFCLYWAIAQKHRWIVLLIASYYFYMSWNPKYVLLILLTTMISYVCGILVEKELLAVKNADGSNISEESAKKARAKAKLYIVLALVVCLGVLFFFKYFDFMSESVCSILNAIAIPVHPVTLRLILPVGISFYTFQSLSYVLDVYKGEVEAQKNFGKYALFISFFPQLVAGPIERTRNLMPQLFEDRKFDEEKAVLGLRLMLIGYFKKLVLSDALARYVDKVYDNVHFYFGLSFIVATILFTFQIYCDFSGYSDIAIGTARLLNVDLMKNFDSPYWARSIRQFWSRWHISLSTWFRDYVYIPMGGSRVKKSRHIFNTIFTMLVSGLWHGANWTFVVWGGLHGVYQAIEGLLKKGSLKKYFDADFSGRENTFLAKLYAFGQGIVTFALVSFAWIFFRANSMSDAIYVATHLHNGVIHFSNAFLKMMIDMGFTNFSFAKVVIGLAVLMTYDYFAQKKDLLVEYGKLPQVVRWLGYLAITCLIVVLKLHGGTTQSFIYFQF